MLRWTLQRLDLETGELLEKVEFSGLNADHKCARQFKAWIKKYPRHHIRSFCKLWNEK